MNIRDLKLRLRALVARRRLEHDLDEELAFHLEHETRRQIANGASPDEARIRARARFGSVPLAADQCRDARGTAFVDGCMRDIFYAFRTFLRVPLAALTIVTTVALGLGLVAVVFTFFNVFMFRVDAVVNPGELFAVERPRSPGGDRVRFTRPQYDALRNETDVFSDAFAMLPDIDSRIDGRMLSGTLVSGNFFQVLGVNAALGRALTPADDERYAPRPVMVLSHRGWSTRFASDPSVVGRSQVVNGFSYTIVGVMPEGFRGLGIAPPDYWAPFSLLTQFRPIHAGREDAVGIDIVGRLKPGLSRRTALAGLVVWDSGRTVAGVRRTVNVTLEPRQGTLPQPVEAWIGFTPIFFAFGLILMIGCANVASLLLARAVSRQREIGVRLSLGASRPRIVRQLLTESLTIARIETYLLQIAFWVTFVLGGLALVLTLSGLFSVLSYLVEQRRKEIAVRMALGATTRDVGGMVLSQSIRPVGFGLIAGTGLAAGLATVLMATPAASTIGRIVHVFDPVSYAGSLVCIVTACALAALIPALRAARIDPMKALRQE